MAQTKKTSTKDAPATQIAQPTERPESSAPSPTDNGIESWLHEEILARLGPISGQALITASHAHGDRRLDWMAECLEVQGHAALADVYRQRKREDLARQQPDEVLLP